MPEDLRDVPPELAHLLAQLATTPEVDADAAEVLAEIERIERGHPGRPDPDPITAALARLLAGR